MKKINFFAAIAAVAITPFMLAACSDDNGGDTPDKPSSYEPDANYVGKAVGNFDASEWYPGGEAGTTNNVAAACYEDETPMISASAELTEAFHEGELLFERQYTQNTAPYKGLGPASVRRSCLDCHPNYGHGKRVESYKTAYGNGNGYLLVIYHPNSEGSNDGPYISEVTGMPQTQAVSPFKAPIEEDGVHIKWEKITAMESGLPLQFPDGEKYELSYPEVTIDADKFHTSPMPSNYAVRLESTIGVIGTGLLDAVPEEEIKAQYKSEADYFKSAGLDVTEYVNPNFWNATTDDWGTGALYTTLAGKMADGSDGTGKKIIKRFTYALTRGTLQDGPGANAIWNITNVSRPDRSKLYTTSAWAQAMSEDADVINAIKADPTSPYYAQTDAEIAEKVKNLLDPNTNQFDNKWHNFKPEMTSAQFYSFMVWHRGLAIPRARNLNDSQVQRGKELFNQMGCTNCHRAKWQTGSDNYWTPEAIADKPLPRYQNQTIYPYTDFMQHKLYMKNDIHGSWCRTTPLWGRGLSAINTGSEDRMHDCRAHNEIEAIMWHAYSKKSHAYSSALKFYNLPKADRDAVVKFLQSI